MRILFSILLGLAALGAIVMAARRLWTIYRGKEQSLQCLDQTEESELSRWLQSRQGKLFIVVMSGLCLLLAIDRVASVGGEIPNDLAPIPRMDDRPVPIPTAENR